MSDAPKPTSKLRRLLDNIKVDNDDERKRLGLILSATLAESVLRDDDATDAQRAQAADALNDALIIAGARDA
jgi:hypothetical protein